MMKMHTNGLVLITLVWASMMLLTPVNVLAHAGHDQGSESTPAPVTGSTQAKLTLNSENIELVAVVKGDGLLIYLDKFDTNEPIANASVNVESKGHNIKAKAAGAPGVYTIDAPWLHDAGDYELLITIETDKFDDMLIGNLKIPVNEHAESTSFLQGLPQWSKIWEFLPQWVYLLVALSILIAVIFYYRARLNKSEIDEFTQKNKESLRTNRAA